MDSFPKRWQQIHVHERQSKNIQHHSFRYNQKAYNVPQQQWTQLQKKEARRKKLIKKHKNEIEDNTEVIDNKF